MKTKAAYLLLLGCMAFFAVSCSEKADSTTSNPEQGCVTFAIDTHTRAEIDDSQYPWSRCAIRIYKHTEVDGEPRKELIRRYNSRRELPEALWLLTGDYSIAVELGDQSAASFDKPFYRGEKAFTIAQGATTVEVECRVVNTIVKVVYDPTIAATFKESYSTTVAFDQPAGWETSASVAGPHLTFEKTAAGYFLLPEKTSTLDWCFCGSGEKDGAPLELKTTGTKAIETTPGLCYELKLKYSKDLGGFLDFTLSLDESFDEIDDPITFVPNPQIAGVGFDMSEPQRFETRPLAFTIASIGDMQTVSIETAAGIVYEVAAATAPENADGIAVECADEANLTVTLGARFFAQLPGGDNALKIIATDCDGGEGEKTLTVRTSGALAPTSDPWFDDLKWRACILQATSAATLEYRYQGETEWSTAELTQPEGDIRTTTQPLARIGTICEYRLLLDGVPTGAVQHIAYPQGPQVYNAGFEVWTGSSPLLPYTSGADQWWDTGNHGSATLSVNVTTSAKDARPGSAGTTSAKLQSQYVAMLGIGKFAAGNIFVGQYLGTNGTNGSIGFGKPFAFTYRPKALRFWYKGTVGSVDHAGGSVNKGDSDVNQIYLCLCKMEGPHVVDTRYTETFLNFAENNKTMPYCSQLNGASSANDRTDGHIVAWAEWNNTQSMPEWTEITLDLHYNEEYEGEVPTYLLLTASASKYGDYFAGSTSSCIYLDDMELVY